MEIELERTTQFMVAPPKMKYLGINLTKYVQDLYEENYKPDERSKENKTNEEILQARGYEGSTLSRC